jgi:signal transduction histidine kinase
MALTHSEAPAPRWAWPAVAVLAFLAPALLLVHTALVWRDLDTAREAYLRSLAGSVAARASMGEALMEEEPAVVSIKTIESPSTADERRVLSGEQLYALDKGETAWRVTVPLDTAGGQALARIEIAVSAADFLTARARQTLGVSLAAGLAMLALGGWGVLARRRQARLEQLAELGKMSAVLAHEIRNPLGTIKGFTQLAREKAPPEITSLLDTALRQTGRLEDLVRDLLLYARPPRPAVSRLEWSEMAGRIREHGLQTRNERSAELLVEDSDAVYETDPALLEQILLNLVRNGLEAAKSLVVVTAAPGRIQVTDDGPGFSEEALRRAFEPFHTTKAQGTGLGLAVARNMARSLGADLTISSTADGGARMELAWK